MTNVFVLIYYFACRVCGEHLHRCGVCLSVCPSVCLCRRILVAYWTANLLQNSAGTINGAIL